jgi:CHAT domain
LEQGQFQVLHYAGHSDMGVAGGSLYLVNSRTGLTEILSGDDLAGLLVNNGVRLAVFNSCRGAHTAAEPKGERDRNLAEALVSRGIPAVLAMAEQIPDHVALTLTWLFYRNLKQGYPVDLSLSRARQGLISTYGSNQLYWALPILYQHPEFDGYLTPGDRNFDNPADRLVLMPQGYNSLPIAEVEPAPDLPLAPEPGEEEMVWNAVLEEDDLGDWADDLEYPEESDDEDAEVVADLLGQLNLRPLPGISERSRSLPPEPPVAPVRGTTRQDSAPKPTLRLDAGNTQITVLDPSPLTTQEDAAVEAFVPPVQHIPVESLQGKRTDSQRYSSHRSTAKSGGLGSVERKALLPFAGAAGALVIALLGYWLAPQVQWAGLLSKIPDAPSLLATNQDLQNRETNELTAIASDRFTKGQLPEGTQALSILLDRGALPEAAAIIQAIPATQVDDPGVSYLRGRLAWQSIQTGNPDYQLSDVVRDWESAVKAQPDSVEFHKALGFAYYAQDRPRDALRTWADARDLLEMRQKSPADSPDDPSGAIENADRSNVQSDSETLTIYAGIALAVRQLVNDPIQPVTDRSGKPSKIYQMVLSRDPINFLPQALGKNWLWNESAIKDWQALAQES